MLLLMLYVDANRLAASHLNRFPQPQISSYRLPLQFGSPNLHPYRRPYSHSSIFTTAKPLYTRRGGFLRRAGTGAGGESPYQVLGVSTSATPLDIKRAYRKLALKYHPDVNKDPGAQEKFMRIKNAYNTLLNSKSRPNKASASRTSSSPRVEEDFYGFGDFFRDVQQEFRSWETNASAQEKPKSLWEELSEIGEEFVEFLEKELNITEEVSRDSSQKDNKGEETDRSNMKNEDGGNSSIEDDIDDIEATLAQLKKELGL